MKFMIYVLQHVSSLISKMFFMFFYCKLVILFFKIKFKRQVGFGVLTRQILRKKFMKIGKFLHQVAIRRQKYRRVLIFFYCHNSFAAKLELTFLWTDHKKIVKKKKHCFFSQVLKTQLFIYLLLSKIQCDLKTKIKN